MRPFLPSVDAPADERASGPQFVAVWLALLLAACAFWTALAWALWRLWATYIR